MAITFLAAVKDTMVRANVIRSTDTFTSFTDSANQQKIDVMIQAWNEVVDELISASGGSYPQEIAEGTLTLVNGQKAYDIASDLSITDFASIALDSQGGAVFIDETNGNVLRPYPGGFDGMRRTQLQPSQYTGLPQYWTMNEDGDIELDYAPTANEAGRAYKFLYNKTINLSSTTDTFPIVDEAVRTLYPAVVQVWRREQDKEWSERTYRESLGRAAGYLRRTPIRKRYA